MNSLAPLCLLLALSTCQPQMEPVRILPSEKIGGVSFVAPTRPIDSATLATVQRVRANWVCLMPYAMGSQGVASLHYNQPRQWWGERAEGIAGCTQLAHRQGLKVMIKPQVWLHDGTYTGHFKLKTEADWQAFEAQYRDFILGFARLADSLGVELFCLGTEFDAFVAERPAFWKSLIAEVRGVFAGKLTYAANWNSYAPFPHWAALDVLGVNAYFPLCPRATPTPETLDAHWQPWLRELEIFQKKTGKPVVFTEYGYRSQDGCTRQPWEAGGEAPANPEAQRLAYEALYRQFWDKPWFGGGFLWKWYDREQLTEGDSRWFRRRTDYTPQGKPAEAVIKVWYGKATE